MEAQDPSTVASKIEELASEVEIASNWRVCIPERMYDEVVESLETADGAHGAGIFHNGVRLSYTGYAHNEPRVEYENGLSAHMKSYSFWMKKKCGGHNEH